MSYSTMKNLKSIISSTNLKKLNKNQNKESAQKCKCEQDKKIVQCPVNKKCTKDNVMYQAEVNSKFATKYYIRMTAGRSLIGIRNIDQRKTQPPKGYKIIPIHTKIK